MSNAEGAMDETKNEETPGEGVAAGIETGEAKPVEPKPERRKVLVLDKADMRKHTVGARRHFAREEVELPLCDPETGEQIYEDPETGARVRAAPLLDVEEGTGRIIHAFDKATGELLYEDPDSDGEKLVKAQPVFFLAELLQPSAGARNRILAAAGVKRDGTVVRLDKMQTLGVIECAVVPGTDTRVYDATDYDTIDGWPAGGWADKLWARVSRVLNVDTKAAKKKSVSPTR
jgi:hypothetical protein